MKVIKQLFKSLEKQGLLKGRLHVKSKAFVYDREQGVREEPTQKSMSQREASRDGIDVDVKVKKPEPTIRRGAESPSKIQAKKKKPKKEPKETGLLPKLLIPLVVIVAVLTVAIIILNKNLSESETDPAAVSENEAGEQIDKLPDANIPIVDDSVDPGEEDAKDQPNETKTPEAKIRKKRPDSKKIVVDKKPETDKPAPYRATITIREIPDTLSHQYSQQLKILRVDLPRKTSVSGYLGLNVFINESGKVFLASINETAIKIDPDSKKKKVMKNLREVIKELKLPVPVDREGRSVKVSNWRLNYQVTQFKRRMILRKQ